MVAGTVEEAIAICNTQSEIALILMGILNLLLTMCFWIPGVVHALFVVNNDVADQRAVQMIAAVKRETMGFLKK